MSSPRSFVDSFRNVKEGRYNPKMSPAIPKHKWRKGSQRLKRRHFIDTTNTGEGFLKNFLNHHNCISDEHYVQTLLAMNGLEAELEQRTLTYSTWNLSAGKKDRKSWHPITFQYANASQQQIKEIKDINHIYYESEDRTEQCHINSTLAPCFLFARKFSPGAAVRLLTAGVVGPYDATTLLNTLT